MDWDKQIESLKQQQKQSEEIYIKCQGAIEVLEKLKEESQNKEETKEDKTKQNKK